jgi:hypothetical protein
MWSVTISRTPATQLIHGLAECVFLPVWRLSSFMMSAQYDVCIPVLYLHSCVISVQLYVCLLVWCTLNGMMSARLCDACSTIWCLPTYNVCLVVRFVPTRMMSAQLCHVCLPVLMFAQLYDVCLSVHCLLYCTVWCLPICTMSAYLYGCCLTVWCLPF